MMKQDNNQTNWTWMMVLSVFIMITGFLLSLYGLHVNSYPCVYIGIGVMSVTSIVWWCWVMFVIRDMFNKLSRTTNQLGEVKSELSAIKKLIRNLFSINK